MAVQKVWDVSELVTNLLALLDPLSVSQLVESGVIDKEGLKKSLSLKAWNQIIKRSAYDGAGQLVKRKEDGTIQVFTVIPHERDLKDLVKILK